jgi:hypothetical protein
MKAVIILERQLFMTGIIMPVLSTGIMKRYEFDQAYGCVINTVFMIVFEQRRN